MPVDRLERASRWRRTRWPGSRAVPGGSAARRGGRSRSGVPTSPRPKWCCQTRFTNTRAVSGWSGRVEPLRQVGRASAGLRTVGPGRRVSIAGKPGSTVAPLALDLAALQDVGRRRRAARRRWSRRPPAAAGIWASSACCCSAALRLRPAPPAVRAARTSSQVTLMSGLGVLGELLLFLGPLLRVGVERLPVRRFQLRLLGLAGAVARCGPSIASTWALSGSIFAISAATRSLYACFSSGRGELHVLVLWRPRRTPAAGSSPPGRPGRTCGRGSGRS